MSRGTAMRRLVMVVALITWIFAWTVLHGASSYFGNKGLPEWLAVLFFFPLLLTIGATVTGAMRLPVWPWLAIFGGIALVVVMIGVQLAELHATADVLRRAGEHRSVTLPLALQRQFKEGAVQVVFFVVAPVVLVGTGLVAWLSGPRRIFVPEGPVPGGPLPEGPHAA